MRYFDEDEEAAVEEEVEEDLLLEHELAEPVGRRIDDPVRMYLTQMGEIPLLSRDEEISLARKIELTRMAFRRKVLESDFCANQAVDILQQVHDGLLPFDRTMKMSTSENLVRSVVKKRLPQNIETINKLLKITMDLFHKSLKAADINEAKVRHQAHSPQSPQGRDAAGRTEPAYKQNSADDEKASGHTPEDASA